MNHTDHTDQSAYPNLNRLQAVAEGFDPIRINGKVTQVVGLVVESNGPGASVGGLCQIYTNNNHPPIDAEVVGFKEGKTLLMPLGDTRGIRPGARIVYREQVASLKVGKGMLGRVLNGLGLPMDGKGPIELDEEFPIYASPINPLHRKRISDAIDVGIRAINALLTIGKGQRVGIFSGSGVGKSTLMGMIAQKTAADVSVIALIGERGREVNEFLEKSLGPDGLRRSVVIAATSDQPPLIRIRGAFVAATIAEYFRSLGRDVILMQDSVTRLAMAQREVGLAIGEPPTSKGYTPSVFTMLPRLMERSGTWDKPGSITGIYTILMDRDDPNDVLADATRAILDGHIMLSRDLASRNHYPCIDVLESISRLMVDIVPEEQVDYSKRILAVLSDYHEAEDLINIGAYAKGSNKRIDYAISMVDKVNDFLKQDIDERVDYKKSVDELKALFN